MKIATAQKVAEVLRWASGSPEWRAHVTATHPAGDGLREYRWLDDKPNLGAFRVLVPERPLLNLVLADEYENGNYYLAVYLKDTANTFVELHKTARSGKGTSLVWKYGPTKQDGRNDERKALFERLTGGLQLQVGLPLLSTADSVRWFIDDLFYLAEARIAADGLDEDAVLDPSEFPEGRVVERLHRFRERSSRVVTKAKQLRMEQEGRLECDCCGFDFSVTYGARGHGFIEAHHTIPVSELEPDTPTRVEDLALVCANCHRMLHRTRPWLTMAELEALLP